MRWLFFPGEIKNAISGIEETDRKLSSLRKKLRQNGISADIGKDIKVKKNLKDGAGALINAYNGCREKLAKKKKRSALRRKK